MSFISRILGRRRYARTTPSDEEVATVDVPSMIERARARGDQRRDNEIAAALLLGADLTVERHPDVELRRRAAAASVATREWLLTRIDEEEVERLLATSLGPVGEDGTLPRQRR